MRGGQSGSSVVERHSPRPEPNPLRLDILADRHDVFGRIHQQVRREVLVALRLGVRPVVGGQQEVRGIDAGLSGDARRLRLRYIDGGLQGRRGLQRGDPDGQ